MTLARPLHVTFHRAFDVTRDLSVALHRVLETGADRVLTSGTAQTAEAGIETIAQLVKLAAGRIKIVAGGGIREDNVRHIVEKTGVRELHAALQTPVPSPMRFRNEKITMGSVGGRDHQRFEVQPETVTRLLEAASKAIPPPTPRP